MGSLIKRNCLLFLIFVAIISFAGCGNKAEKAKPAEFKTAEAADSAINSENFPELSEASAQAYEQMPFVFDTEFDTVFVDADMQLSNSYGVANLSYTGYIDFNQNKQVVKTKTSGLSQLLATEYVTDLVSGQTKVTFSDGSMIEVPSGLDALDYKKELEALLQNETVEQISENTYEVTLSEEQRVGYEKLLSSTSEYALGEKTEISLKDGYISQVELFFFDKKASAGKNKVTVKLFDYNKQINEEE